MTTTERNPLTDGRDVADRVMTKLATELRGAA
jgi:hypothetical protein